MNLNIDYAINQDFFLEVISFGSESMLSCPLLVCIYTDTGPQLCASYVHCQRDRIQTLGPRKYIFITN